MGWGVCALFLELAAWNGEQCLARKAAWMRRKQQPSSQIRLGSCLDKWQKLSESLWNGMNESHKWDLGGCLLTWRFWYTEHRGTESGSKGMWLAVSLQFLMNWVFPFLTASKTLWISEQKEALKTLCPIILFLEEEIDLARMISLRNKCLASQVRLVKTPIPPYQSIQVQSLPLVPDLSFLLMQTLGRGGESSNGSELGPCHPHKRPGLDANSWHWASAFPPNFRYIHICKVKNLSFTEINKTKISDWWLSRLSLRLRPLLCWCSVASIFPAVSFQIQPNGELKSHFWHGQQGVLCFFPAVP